MVVHVPSSWIQTEDQRSSVLVLLATLLRFVKLPIQITLVPIVPVETEEHVVYNLDLIILVLVLWAGKVSKYFIFTL